MKIEVSKITIKVGKLEIKLTVDEARELRDALDKVLEGKVAIPFVPYIPRPSWGEPPYRITIVDSDNTSTATGVHDYEIFMS